MEDPLCIPLSSGGDGFGHLESALVSIDCSQTSFRQYWNDSQYIFVDVVNLASFQSVGFGSIETQSVDCPFFMSVSSLVDFDTPRSTDVCVLLYSNDTGFRSGCVTLSFCFLPQSSVNSSRSQSTL